VLRVWIPSNSSAAAYVRIAALASVRAQYPSLRYGRQYQRPLSNFGGDFALPAEGELIAWSRILDDEEALCVLNGHGTEARGGDVVVDSSLNSSSAAGNPWAGAEPFFKLIANSEQAAAGSTYTGTHPTGSKLQVSIRDGAAYVSLRNIAPSEVLVLINRP